MPCIGIQLAGHRAHWEQLILSNWICNFPYGLCQEPLFLPLLPPFARGSHYEAKSGFKLVTLPASAGTIQMYTATTWLPQHFLDKLEFSSSTDPSYWRQRQVPLILRLGRIQEQCSKALYPHTRVYFPKKMSSHLWDGAEQ